MNESKHESNNHSLVDAHDDPRNKASHNNTRDLGSRYGQGHVDHQGNSRDVGGKYGADSHLSKDQYNDSHDPEDAHHDSRHKTQNSANSSKLELLKQNLQNLESKVKDLRDTRQKKKNDVVEQQQKLNQELSAIVAKRAKQGELKEADISGVVKEQVDHQPNSLTKENILLKQENQKLKDDLLKKNSEIELLHLQLKQLKKARDDGLDRIGELSKIIESKQSAEELGLRRDNVRAYETDKNMREQRVGLANQGPTARQEGRLRRGSEEGRRELLEDFE